MLGRAYVLCRGQGARATIEDQSMRSLLSRFIGSLLQASASKRNREADPANKSGADALRDTIPVRRWQCQRLPIRFSLRLPVERHTDQGNRDSS
jgi:hypothetical protein